MSEEEEVPVVSRALWRAQTGYLVRIRSTEGDDPERSYTALDLSTGGLFAAGAPHLAAGATVHVEVELPAWTFCCHGEVRWVREERVSPAAREGMGIAFAPLSDEECARLRDLIEDLRP